MFTANVHRVAISHDVRRLYVANGVATPLVSLEIHHVLFFLFPVEPSTDLRHLSAIDIPKLRVVQPGWTHLLLLMTFTMMSSFPCRVRTSAALLPPFRAVRDNLDRREASFVRVAM